MKDALEAALGPLESEPEPLDGGITNRNFRARLGGAEYVVRRHGRGTELLGIDRGAERLATQAAASLGIAPTLAATLDGGLVTSYVPCSPPEPGELRERAPELARTLRAFHDCGIELPVSFHVPELLARYERLVAERDGALPAEWMRTVHAAERIAGALARRETVERPCHNDLLPGNLIRAGDGRIMIVDWEYAGMGAPLFDLANLSVNNDFDEAADERLLAAYDGTPPSPSRRAALRLMRVLSDAREAAWGVVQGVISDLDFDFEGYARRHFTRLLGTVESTDFEEWLAAA